MADGPDGGVKRGDDAQDAERKAAVGADNAEGGAVWQFGFAAAVVGPGLAEADMAEADGAPDEEVCQSGKREQPVKEDGPALRRFVDKGEETEGELDEDAVKRAAVLVDVGEEVRRHAVCGEGLHCARAAEGAAVGYAEDGDGDDGVEDGGEAFDTSELDCVDEGGGFGVGARGVEEDVRVRRNDEADHQEGNDVELLGLAEITVSVL